MIDYLEREGRTIDYCLFFSYRYYHAWHGGRRLSNKAILVPTAERDPAIGLSIFGPLFRGVRGVMYNSHEERVMIQAATKNEAVPGVVVGVGSDVPDRVDPCEIPPPVQDQSTLRDLRRPYRRKQGMRRALRFLSALRGDASARARFGARRQGVDGGANACSAFTISVFSTTKTSSTAWRRPTC